MDPEKVQDIPQIPAQDQTPAINMWSINVDPKLLATHLEENRSDQPSTTSPLFHQPLQAQQETPEVVAPEVQVVEKIVYQKQRVHGFFRTLTLLTLLFVGILMLLEGLWIFSLSIAGVAINMFYPVFIILSVIVIWSYKWIFGKVFGLLMFLSVVAGFFVLSVYSSLTPSSTNATGFINAVNVWSAPYSKVYISTLINALHINSQTWKNLLLSTYDAERPLLITSGQVLSGHNYIIVSESDQVNLLERVYTHLDIGLDPYQPVYLYNKTLLGQNSLDLSTLNVRGLRLYGAVVSRDVIFWSGETIAAVVSWTDILSGSIVLSGAIASSGTLETGSLMSWVVSKVVSKSIESPKMSTIHVDLQAAVADVTLHLPKTMWVRIHYKSYIGKTDFSDFTEKEKDTYESANIDKATSIVDINAVFGLSRFTILQDR